MRKLKTALTLRGDHYYCPLALQLSTYWNCENECNHCYLRRMNRTWGNDLRPLDIEILEKQVYNAKNYSGKNPLKIAVKNKKTIYLGAKSDAYQNAEKKYKVTRKALRILLEEGYSIVIATMFTDNVYDDMELLLEFKNQVILMPIVSPGLDKDWEILEKKATTRPIKRIKAAADFQKQGFQIGINGEPFIPGFHTIKEFSYILDLLKEYNLKNYNTYNLHLNDWNAKKMFNAGIDIEKVWKNNKDNEWRRILFKLIKIAELKGIILGCPDFVNSGKYVESVNTCCGINVPNPCTFNLINWKKMKKAGMDDEKIIEKSWDGVGNKEYGKKLLLGEIKELYSLKDIKEIK
jgi:DNA repair photolyase